MSNIPNTTIAFNYFGGKYTWLTYLYDCFPSHFTHLVDVFAGSMVVSLNYRGRAIKTANEINSDITNFFKILRDQQDELVRLLLLTPCSLEEYNNCWEISDDKVEQARRFYVRVRQSFFGLGAQRKNKGWHMAKTQLNANRGETVSRWNNAIEKLYDVAEIIRTDFQITNLDYRDCIKKIDNKNAFFYPDPPYAKESRKSYNDYKYEFTDDNHRELAELVHNIKGMAMVSGYNCNLMDELYGDWYKTEFPIKKNNIRSSEVQEVIWTNYKPNKLDLFSNLYK